MERQFAVPREGGGGASKSPAMTFIPVTATQHSPPYIRFAFSLSSSGEVTTTSKNDGIIGRRIQDIDTFQLEPLEKKNGVSLPRTDVAGITGGVGKVVHVVFWTTRCNRCPSVLSRLETLATEERFRDTVTFIAVNTDDAGVARKMIGENEWGHLVHTFCPAESKAVAVAELGLKTVPHYTTLARDGTVIQNGTAKHVDLSLLEDVIADGFVYSATTTAAAGASATVTTANTTAHRVFQRVEQQLIPGTSLVYTVRGSKTLIIWMHLLRESDGGEGSTMVPGTGTRAILPRYFPSGGTKWQLVRRGMNEVLAEATAVEGIPWPPTHGWEATGAGAEAASAAGPSSSDKRNYMPDYDAESGATVEYFTDFECTNRWVCPECDVACRRLTSALSALKESDPESSDELLAAFAHAERISQSNGDLRPKFRQLLSRARECLVSTVIPARFSALKNAVRGIVEHSGPPKLFTRDSRLLSSELIESIAQVESIAPSAMSDEQGEQLAQGKLVCEHTFRAKLAKSANSWGIFSDAECGSFVRHFLGGRMSEWTIRLSHCLRTDGGVANGLGEAMQRARDDEIDDAVASLALSKKSLTFGRTRALKIMWRCIRDGERAVRLRGALRSACFGELVFFDPVVPGGEPNENGKCEEVGQDEGMVEEEQGEQKETGPGGSSSSSNNGAGAGDLDSGDLAQWSVDVLVRHLAASGSVELSEACAAHDISGLVAMSMAKSDLNFAGFYRVVDRQAPWEALHRLQRLDRDRLLTGMEHEPVSADAPLALDDWTASHVQSWLSSLRILSRETAEVRSQSALIMEGLSGADVREFTNLPVDSDEARQSVSWWGKLDHFGRNDTLKRIRVWLELRSIALSLRWRKKKPYINLAKAIRALVVDRILAEIHATEMSVQAAVEEEQREAGVLRLELLSVARKEKGARILRLHVERSIGQGGFGKVWLVSDRVSGNKAVLKHVDVSISTSDGNVLQEEIRKIQDEQTAMEAVKSDFVVRALWPPVFNLSSSTPRCFFTLPFYSGGDLKQRIARCPVEPIVDAELERWAAQLLRGLCAISRAGLVHRDIKPENIFLEERGGGVDVLIGDLGLAAFVTSAGEDGASLSLANFAGTLRYAAPEQSQTRKNAGVGSGGARASYRRAVDVFSLGLVFWEMCCEKEIVGSNQFVGSEQLAAKIEEAARHRSQLPTLVKITANMLTTDPNERLSPDRLLRAYEDGGSLPPADIELGQSSVTHTGHQVKNAPDETPPSAVAAAAAILTQETGLSPKNAEHLAQRLSHIFTAGPGHAAARLLRRDDPGGGEQMIRPPMALPCSVGGFVGGERMLPVGGERMLPDTGLSIGGFCDATALGVQGYGAGNERKLN